MSSSVTFPTWFAIILVGLAGLALLDRIFIPSFRWMMRRRINRAIDQLNTRLRLKIQPFKLTKRQVLIDRILHDPAVIKAVEEAADADGVPREVKMQRARSYAREIVPSFNAYV